MQELGTQLGRYVSGLIDIDELRDEFLRYLKLHPQERDQVTRWLDEAVRKGRLAPAVADLLSQSIARARGVPVPAGDASEPFTARPTMASILAREQATPMRRKGELQASDTGPLQPGTVVRERFVLMEELGRGGMGQVFKARDLRREEAQDRNPYVALKVLSADFSAHPDSFIALQREARRASTLAHPNVVTVYDFDRDGGRIYMTMEYLEGRGLDSYLRSECTKGVPLATCWPIVRGIGAALEYAHQKRIIHSDLKPGNVFLCTDGAVKVLDFGIARLTRPVDSKTDVTLFDAGDRLGGLTPAYASLEMWNREPPDPRDDLYALACVTYELLSGRHPYGRASAKEAFDAGLTPRRIDSLKRAQWEALKKGLALKRDQRTPTITEFLQGFAPPSNVRKYALLTVLGVTIVIAGAIAISARYYQEARQNTEARQDIEFLKCAAPTRAPPSLGKPPEKFTPEMQRQIDENLMLADDNWANVTPDSSLDDLKASLSEGIANVVYLADQILQMNPREQRALDLKARVAKEYATRARALYNKGEYASAWEYVREARVVDPLSRELFKLEGTICLRVPAVSEKPAESQAPAEPQAPAEGTSGDPATSPEPAARQ
jgi:serine/threonine protein kinase